jgi:hypothetical protein
MLIIFCTSKKICLDKIYSKISVRNNLLSKCLWIQGHFSPSFIDLELQYWKVKPNDQQQPKKNRTISRYIILMTPINCGEHKFHSSQLELSSLGRFSSSTSESPTISHSFDSSTLIIMYYPSVSRLSRQCWILNITQPYRWMSTTTNWTVSTAKSSQYLAVNCEPIV